MKSRMLSKIAFLVGVSISLFARYADPQTSMHQRAPTYFELVDIAFRYSESLPSESKNIDSRVVIRYLPGSEAPETQFVILKYGNGTVAVTRYNVRKGTPSISEVYNQAFARKKNPAIVDIVHNLSIEKRDLGNSDVVLKLLDQLSRLSIPTKLSHDICTDGITYELRIENASNKLHASLSDCAYDAN
jgi:hypothetical protein